MKRYLLEYEVSKGGESIVHKEKFSTMDQLDAWFITTTVAITKNGGTVSQPSITALDEEEESY